MYTSQDTIKRFLTLNDKGKKDFILEVLKLKDFDKLLEMARKGIKEGELTKFYSSKIYRFFNREISSSTCEKVGEILQKENE